MIWARNLKLLTKLGVAALALGAWATSANAQSAYQGKFTLPVETHWGGATLPAGNYSLVLPSMGAPYKLYIRGEGVNVMVFAVTTEGIVARNQAQLDLVNIADVRTVQTFDVPELGLSFIYSTPAQKHMGRKEAHQKPLPQTGPASQVSENKTSIEVHTAGR
jgi:hypothetical protein